MRAWWRRWRRRIGVGAVVVYLIVVFGVADYLIILPMPGQANAGAARREWVDVDGGRVECWVARSEAARTEEPRAYVLEFCGQRTRAEWIAQYVPQRWKNYPVETWVMNYPGVGGSEGHARLANIAPAALGVYDALARHGKPVFVEANSLGTTAALCVAARRDVAGCVLHDPVPLKQLILANYGWWNLWTVAIPVAWRVPHELDSVDNAKHARGPCVFLLAEKDEFVLPRFHRMIVDAYGGDKQTVVLLGKGHNDSVGKESEQEIGEKLGWLWKKSASKNN